MKNGDRPSVALKKAIENCGISRYALAKRCGVSESALSRFKSGERGLSLDALDRLADALDLRLGKQCKCGRSTQGAK